MRSQIINASIVLEDGILRDGICCYTDGIIDYIGTDPQPGARTVQDAKGGLLLPGFVDIHCHGGAGYDFMDAQPEEMEQIARFHLSHGTTTLFATTMTDRWEYIHGALARIERLFDSGRQQNVTGIHLEGPWLSPIQCGAQSTDCMELPDLDKLRQLVSRYPHLRRISAAPELPGGLELARVGRELGLVMSVAHTDGDFDRIQQAAEEGYTLMTHLYSGMNMTHRVNAFRVAGAVEAGLYDDRLSVELIADGVHLPAALLKLVLRCKGTDKICLVTDAMRGAGLPDGSCTKLGRMDGGVDVILEDGVAKLPDRTSFAGSVATTDRLLRTMLEGTGVDLVSVSRMLSATPARVMGLTDRGSIEVGKRADLVLLDEKMEVKQVFLGGNEI